MGALTVNRKRGEDFMQSHLSGSSTPIDQSYGRISKKPRLADSSGGSAVEFTGTASSNSIAWRISQYPQPKPFTRQVHAPVRNSKFGTSSSSSASRKSVSEDNSADKIGRPYGFWLHSQYEITKREAIGSLRYVSEEYKESSKKDKKKEVIVIDVEEEIRDDVLNYSSVEEMDIVGNERMDVGTSQDWNVETAVKELQAVDTSGATDISEAYLKVIPHDLSLPLYKKLLEKTTRREYKLDRLKNDIEIYELSARRFKSLRPQKKVEQEQLKDIAEECFTPLTEEEESEVSQALSYSNRRKVMVLHENSGIDITGEKLQCLGPGAWLNDEVINVYLELLKEREKREPKKFLKCHFFNTFFYKKLISGRDGYNYQSVRRWTTQRKLGYSLLECDKIFVPIHKEIHWCLAIINKKEEKFQYLDSLNGVDSQVLSVLARYFVDEVKEKCGKDIDVSSWEKEFVMDLPQQENGFDCGMFMVKYADFFSRDIGLCFGQEHMPYFRKRTAKELLKLRAD